MPIDIDRLRSALADRYAIEREIGRGSTATVYLAEDLKHGRQVAVKVLEPELASSIGSERFLREIETAARLNHPHILPLYDSGEADGFLYYAMPYMESSSLRDLLDREGQLPVEDAVRIAREVAEGLDYAHEQGVVHRDIKPGNIMLSRGHAVIADFGIAHAISEAGSERLTETGLAIGTPAYMSPEQSTGDGELDARSDSYSLACVLYEMLAGEPPHSGPTAQAIIAKRLSASVPSVKIVRETVPDALDRALTRALARVPADRFATAAEFASALGGAASGPEWVTRPKGPLRVMGLYILSALAVLAVLQFVVARLDLPGWMPPAALVLLLLGLPMVLGAALVQRGATRLPVEASKLLTWRRVLAGGAAAFAILGIVVTAFTLRGGASGARDTAPTEVPGGLVAIAVLPFRSTGPESEFWHESIVNMLSDNFEGIDGFRSVDPRAVLSAWARIVGEGQDAIDVEAEVDVARRVSAQYAVSGSATRLGENLRLSAEVYDVEPGQRRGAPVEVVGSADSVFSLVNRLTVELLRSGELAPDEGEVSSVDLRRVTTTSLPALKAYLAGLRSYQRSRFTQAAQDFQRAVDLDSTFGRAWYRLSRARGWTDEGGIEESRRARRFANELPERDSLLFTAVSSISPAAIPVLETLTHRYPDDVEAWVILAEAYYHLGAPALYPADAFRTALNRALELDPSWGETYGHLIEDAFVRLDSTRLRELIVAYRQTDPEQDPCPAAGIAYDLIWGDSAARILGFEQLDSLASLSDHIQFRCPQTPLLLPERALKKVEQVRRAALDPQYPDLVRWLTLWRMLQARLGLGQYTMGRQLLREAGTLPDLRIDAAQWEIMLHASGFPDSVGVRQAVDLLAQQARPLDHFWLGALAVADAQWDGAERAAQALEAQAGDWAWATSERDSGQARLAQAYAEALRTYLALWRGDDSRLSEFEAALSELPSFASRREEPQKFLRYQVGKLLLDRGRAEDAQRYFESFQQHHWPYTIPAMFYLGRIHETLDEPEEALIYYDRFATWWQDADPELQPWVEEAQARMKALWAKQN